MRQSKRSAGLDLRRRFCSAGIVMIVGYQTRMIISNLPVRFVSSILSSLFRSSRLGTSHTVPLSENNNAYARHSRGYVLCLQLWPYWILSRQTAVIRPNYVVVAEHDPDVCMCSGSIRAQSTKYRRGFSSRRCYLCLARITLCTLTHTVEI